MQMLDIKLRESEENLINPKTPVAGVFGFLLKIP